MPITRTKPKHESAQIQSLGYDATTQTMVIEFRGGALYEYSNIPYPLFFGLRDSESPGRYFTTHIKKEADRFPFRRLPSEREGQGDEKRA